MARYAEPPDLVNLGIASAALDAITNQSKIAALEAASRLIDSYYAQCFTLPIVTWTDDTKRACVNIATYDLLSKRGFSPQSGSDENIRLRYEDTIRWLEQVAACNLSPQVTDSSVDPSGGVDSRADVISSSQRGWSSRGETDGVGVPFSDD
jgi:phage gp36-like protein